MQNRKSKWDIFLDIFYSVRFEKQKLALWDTICVKFSSSFCKITCTIKVAPHRSRAHVWKKRYKKKAHRRATKSNHKKHSSALQYTAPSNTELPRGLPVYFRRLSPTFHQRRPKTARCCYGFKIRSATFATCIKIEQYVRRRMNYKAKGINEILNLPYVQNPISFDDGMNRFRQGSLICH